MQQERYTLKIPKHLDTATINAFRDQATSELKDLAENTSLTFDMSETEYVSSAGLRLLVTIMKRFKAHHESTHVNPEVYDILDLTGFTSLMKVRREIIRIEPVTGEPIARGSNGAIYQIAPDTIVKMFTPATEMAEIEEEWQNAKRAFVLGVPSVICYSMVTDGERLGIMFEKMETKGLDALIKADPDHFDDYAERFAELLQDLHATADEDHEFMDVKERLKAVVERADYLTEDECASLNEIIDAVPDSDAVVHGDFHPRNISEAEGELILMDMAEISYGHPLFDFLSTYYDLVFSGKTTGRDHPEVTERYFGLPVPDLRRLWDETLATYFPGITDKELDYFNDTMDMLVGLKVVLFPVLHPNFNQAQLDRWAALGREHCLDHADEVLERIDHVVDTIFDKATT